MLSKEVIEPLAYGKEQANQGDSDGRVKGYLRRVGEGSNLSRYSRSDQLVDIKDDCE